MSVTQISVFAESRPGHLVRILNLFEEQLINVRGFSVADTGEYGILRFVVDKPEQAFEALQAQGFACASTNILCLRLIDKPGELARVMNVLASCNINVLYSYSLISTYIVLAVQDIDHARTLLEAEPVELISQDELCGVL